MARWVCLMLVLSLAACGADVTPPPPGDLAGLQRPPSPNTALAAPAGFVPSPDTTTRRYAVPPERLYAVVRQVMHGRPRTKELPADEARLRADFVERSLVFRFPDVVQVQVLRAPEGQSDLVVYSHAVLGHSDFGVNRRRVAAVLAALDHSLGLAD